MNVITDFVERHLPNYKERLGAYFDKQINAKLYSGKTADEIKDWFVTDNFPEALSAYKTHVCRQQRDIIADRYAWNPDNEEAIRNAQEPE